MFLIVLDGVQGGDSLGGSNSQSVTFLKIIGHLIIEIFQQSAFFLFERLVSSVGGRVGSTPPSTVSPSTPHAGSHMPLYMPAATCGRAASVPGGAAGAVSFKRLGRIQIALSRIANFAISLRAERPGV